ncbi:universal stress protein [Piscinibacter sakaiensis]|uniref:universal stress protein n=1 Tax=Piscinibacter sakaiensis TaxID=1547922 RepID=UPI003AAC9DA5
MDNVFIVGTAGPDLSRRAIDFAVDRAKLAGASVHLVHVIEWSPYTFMTADELAQQHAVRNKHKALGQKMLDDTQAQWADAGVPISGEVRFGHVAEVLCEVAADKKACQIFVGRSGGSPLANRIIGSASLTLVQASPVPVTVIP